MYKRQLLGGLKADAADALDLVLGVGHGVDGLLLAVFQRVGLVIAEVHAADELTHLSLIHIYGPLIQIVIEPGRAQIVLGGNAVQVKVGQRPRPAVIVRCV